MGRKTVLMQRTQDRKMREPVDWQVFWGVILTICTLMLVAHAIFWAVSSAL